MKNIDYEDILSQLCRRRQENIRTQDKRKAEVYEKLPRVKEIDDSIAHLAIQAARNRIRKQHTDGDTEALRAQLREEKRRIMDEAGYPEGYLNPIYSCQSCRDTGYVDGKPCTCLKQMVINELYKQSTIERVLKAENFGAFKADYYRDDAFGDYRYTPRQNALNIVAASKQFIDDFDEKRPGVLLYGETGTGKTFLTNCIAEELLNRGYTVLYLSAIDLFDNILQDIIIKGGREPHQRMIYEYIYGCDFLIIDDLGTEYTNSFVLSQLFEIINKRTIKAQSTLISTNLDLRQLGKRYTERIMSRIVDSYLIFNLYGDNIRYKKRMSKMAGSAQKPDTSTD